MKMNRQILLAKRPVGVPDSSTFNMIETVIPVPKENEVLIRSHYLSVDPYMRGRMNNIKSYAKPFQIGEPLTGDSIGEVIVSKHSGFATGELVIGTFDWADFSIVKGSELQKIHPTGAPITSHLHVTGMTGLTAYFGLLDIGKPLPGETVVVSGAAGAVGMVVGQIAKIKECRVVGIAGSDEKGNFLKDELGFDEVINYKNGEILQKLRNSCPNGIDIYYDNVGGEISDAAISLLNFHGRVPLCGQISALNSENTEKGPRLFTHIIRRSILLKGFIFSDYKEQFEEGRKVLAQWLNEGKIKYKENIVLGLENAPDAFFGLFRGENLGKQLVKIKE